MDPQRDGEDAGITVPRTSRNTHTRLLNARIRIRQAAWGRGIHTCYKRFQMAKTLQQ